MAEPNITDFMEQLDRRRKSDGCSEHEKRMDTLDKDLNRQAGWLKGSASIMVVAVAILGWFGNAITAKLGSIETLLTDSKVTLATHTQQIITLQTDVKEIQELHKSWNQADGVKRK